MSALEAMYLPPGWRATVAERGTDLRVSASGRGYVVAAAAALALWVGWRAAAQADSLPRGELALRLGIMLLLSLLALWCAFGDEVWHLERNCLVHRVGAGRWGHSRRYEDAELQIVCRLNMKFAKPVPYYRLYAVVSGQPHFLMERNQEELQELANFVAFHTGWQIRPQASSPL